MFVQSQTITKNGFKFRCAGSYNYDIHGNVKTLYQDNKQLADLGVELENEDLENQRYKRIDYDYDLVSGKVNQVAFQAGQPDASSHKYEYDADNRISVVSTSSYWRFRANSPHLIA